MSTGGLSITNVNSFQIVLVSSERSRSQQRQICGTKTVQVSENTKRLSLDKAKVCRRDNLSLVCRTGFGAAFAAVFVLIYWFREFPLSAVADRFELRCQLKQLLLLFRKIFPCSRSNQDKERKQKIWSDALKMRSFIHEAVRLLFSTELYPLFYESSSAISASKFYLWC